MYTIIPCVFAITATIPAVAYQTWGFIAPALTKEERIVTQTFIPGLFILFIVGISFGYFLLYSHCAGIFNKYISSD
jgi:sec-independent protein translocase protein TatC